MRRINKIINSGLCLGCGLCETIVGHDNCKMIISKDGFYRPQFNGTISKHLLDEIIFCCPGIHIEGENQKGVWGNVLSVTEAWSANDNLRNKSATGGLISSLALYLLESKKVEGILQVGIKNDSCLENELLVSRTKEDIYRNAQSRYAPALIFDKFKDILEENTDTYVFIGKPCDVAGLKNFINLYPQYKGRIKYTLAIFCAGIPSYNATKELVSRANISDIPIFIKYRGEGWPGDFEARWSNGEKISISYNESWGKVLGRTLGLRCKICPDGIGMLADISTGDSWNTKDGYPDFTEADGRNFCFIRTEKSKKIYDEAVSKGYIVSDAFDISNIEKIHQYQYYRRISSVWRIMAIQLLTLGILKYLGLGLFNLLYKIPFYKGLKEFAGTIKRFY